MGMILMMPLPQVLDVMTVAIATMANSQLVVQFCIALPESTRPMAIIIGPVTSGGKNRSILSIPNDLMRPAITK
jgi:hypothetical protein